MSNYKLTWWKIATIVLLYYVVIAGMLFPVPRLNILNESIRMNYYHVPMWFTMISLFAYSFWKSITFLRTNDLYEDEKANVANGVAICFGALGLMTGMLWANVTWGAFWTSDPKLNNTAIGLLIYLAFFILRGSVADDMQRGRLCAVYNIFAFLIFIPLIFVLPRMTDSLHPGSGDNPTFRLFDTAHNMKLVIYTAIIGFISLGWWINTLFYRLRLLELDYDEID